MPIYEYQCQKCGTFEATQRITDKPLAKCPTCKGKVKKLISNTSFQLKGTGWYVTDYARGGSKGNGSATKSESSSESKAEGKSESKAESKAQTKSEGKAETKPAAKTESKSETKS